MGGRTIRTCSYVPISHTAQVTSNIRVSRQIARIMQDVNNKSEHRRGFRRAYPLFAVQFILPISHPVDSINRIEHLSRRSSLSVLFPPVSSFDVRAFQLRDKCTMDFAVEISSCVTDRMLRSRISCFASRLNFELSSTNDR